MMNKILFTVLLVGFILLTIKMNDVITLQDDSISELRTEESRLKAIYDRVYPRIKTEADGYPPIEKTDISKAEIEDLKVDIEKVDKQIASNNQTMEYLLWFSYFCGGGIVVCVVGLGFSFRPIE